MVCAHWSQYQPLSGLYSLLGPAGVDELLGNNWYVWYASPTEEASSVGLQVEASPTSFDAG